MNMSEYLVLQHFQWGQLILEKGQRVLVERTSDDHSIVSVKHYPEKSQLVGTKSIETMILLQKIKEG